MRYYADVFKTLNLYGWIFYIFWSLEYKSSWLCWFSDFFFVFQWAAWLTLGWIGMTFGADIREAQRKNLTDLLWSSDVSWRPLIRSAFLFVRHFGSDADPKEASAVFCGFMLVNMLANMMKHGGNKSCSFSSGQFYIFIFICVLPVAFRLNNTLLLSIPDCCFPNFPVAVFFFFLSFYFLAFDIQLSPYSIFKFGCVQIMAQETKCCGDATTLSCGNCTFTAWTHPPQPCGADTNDCSSLASSIQYHYNVCLS